MTGDGTRLPLPQKTARSRLIVVARARRAEDYDPVLEALIDAGIRSVELTLTTPGTIEHLPRLVERFGDDADIGIGTVTDTDQLRRAVDAGARYLVTPITRSELVSAAVEAGVPFVPGGFTPTELFASWSAGASAVKVFPAGRLGAGYVKDLRGPFPDIEVVPSGGIGLESAEDWLATGAAAVSVGGPLLGDAFQGGDLGALRERAGAFVAVAAGGRP
ncbi:bifunctional 4-hydroxy-2-oxoglutarate aldolase/2-dehydro-3-deoxy-phosphogluconate aldolase [Leifsonia sp. 1010]|uniref:bifunctional 4-hydroxy-2-oxoglutarate aldolase/2-dehydro-3-deoxy-phosphogluconate aldolase n=1 Tax=Leifsonia sp. 1010 TaxID=2817769 RepID=UPI00285870D1|nr:bifunctional 4-hydroxy-2-oxoglutarate aldolase/2-dehydro-3-deoxy-phosphogluconate aldolase [Leifsonia sp. 1010]MDR6612186.1 2-dehydro-3-deoxyphosphogluconate aldolase/(4S)-4-hydroxy-2-oxoglutarate aldolase [Leifsonia sp. 1010]